MFQSYPVKKFHGNESLAIFLANVVNSADIGMIQRGSGLGLALKTSQGLRVTGDLVRQEFQGHKTVQPGVFGLVNDAHAAATELLDNAVVRDGLADHWRESYVRETSKSMKAVELAAVQQGRWRKIPVTLTDQQSMVTSPVGSVIGDVSPGRPVW